MTRNTLVDRCKALIQEAYEEATEMIVAYLEIHSDEQLQPLCKEVDPENWNALRARVQRAQVSRKATTGTETARTTSEPEWVKIDKRAAKRILRTAPPEQIAELLSEPAVRANVSQAQQIVARKTDPPRYPDSPRVGPSFIDLLVRISGGLIELEALVAGWQNPAAVPAEFSRESFGDIVQKALRIQDRFDELVAAIDNDDEDEFQKIVRNFRLVPS